MHTHTRRKKPEINNTENCLRKTSLLRIWVLTQMQNRFYWLTPCHNESTFCILLQSKFKCKRAYFHPHIWILPRILTIKFNNKMIKTDAMSHSGVGTTHPISLWDAALLFDLILSEAQLSRDYFWTNEPAPGPAWPVLKGSWALLWRFAAAFRNLFLKLKEISHTNSPEQSLKTNDYVLDLSTLKLMLFVINSVRSSEAFMSGLNPWLSCLWLGYLRQVTSHFSVLVSSSQRGTTLHWPGSSLSG